MQNTKLIKKISTSLVSTGEIIDSLQSNSSTSAPSIRAVVDNMTPPMNLLINGDFKINQRGESSYTSKGYSIDMWRISKNSQLIVEEIGVTFTASLGKQGYFISSIPKSYNGKKMTVVCKLYNSDTIYKGTLNLSIIETQIVEIDDKTNITIKCDDEKQLTTLYFNIDCESQVVSKHIEYIDLFEGSIAYPHIEEDYATAMMRCQDWLVFYPYLRTVTTTGYMYNPHDLLYGTVFLPSIMEEKPTVKCESVSIAAGQSSNRYNGKLNLMEGTGNYLFFQVQRSDGSSLPISSDNSYNAIFYNLEITREPL